MLSGTPLYLVAVIASFAIAAVASPVGVSGAVLLLPFQVGVLGTPSPAVTPTNLLYNVIAVPGACYRYWRQHQTGGTLSALLLCGTVPGVVCGSVIRVTLLPGSRTFDVVIAAVLAPVGAWLLLRPQRQSPGDPHRLRLSPPVLVVVSAVVGTIGGIYGIGGGSILAPVLVGSGRPASEVAPATLLSTFVTSVAGVVTFTILATRHYGPVSPVWGVGIALGAGGLVGSYTGARIQRRLPEALIRRLLGLLVLGIGVRYAVIAFYVD